MRQLIDIKIVPDYFLSSPNAVFLVFESLPLELSNLQTNKLVFFHVKIEIFHSKRH